MYHILTLRKFWTLDVVMKLIDGVLKTDLFVCLFVKLTDTHLFLDPTSCHPYHCKKGILYSFKA